MPSKRPSSALNERAQHLLRVLVRQYIEEGQPVGSKSLARASGLDLSAATIRNIMSDLENHGFLASPHTSAGRIPTVRGYRLFVDSLIASRPLPEVQIEELQQQISRETDTQRLMSSVSEFLSGLTKLAGIVTLPRMQRLELRQLEFLPLSDNRVLAILVINEHEVQNRILHLPRTFSTHELQTISNYLNAHFAGKEISEVRKHLMNELRATRERVDQLMQDAISMADSLFDGDAVEDGYVMVGHTKLMEFEELSNVEKLRQLFEAFSQKRDILHLLDQCLNAQGVQIFIGEECGYKVLDDCSVVTASYGGERGHPVGVLGVIGPTRIPYDKVIPIVDITAKVVGAALNSRA